MTTKYNLTRQYKDAIGKPCTYCSRSMKANDDRLWPTKDHVHPRSRGGREIVWACWSCNNLKGDMTLEQWRDYMTANPEWWLKPRRPGGSERTKWNPQWLGAQATLAEFEWPWLRELYRPVVRRCGWNWNGALKYESMDNYG